MAAVAKPPPEPNNLGCFLRAHDEKESVLVGSVLEAVLVADAAPEARAVGADAVLNLAAGFDAIGPLHAIDFSTLAQAGCGLQAASGAPDLKKEHALQFVVSTPIGASSVTLDLWIDDLYLVSK